MSTLEVETAQRMAPPLPVRQGSFFRRHANVIDIIGFIAFLVVVVWLVARGAGAMGYTWQWERVPPYFWRIIDGEIIWGPLIKGLLITLQIAALAIVLTLPLGVATALLRLSDSIVGRFLAKAYIEIIRNTPLLLQVLIFYFIIGRVLEIPRLWCGILTLALYEGTFAAEIIRGAIQSIPRGQWEASKSLGLSSYTTYSSIILPQTMPLVIPPMAGVLVNLVKHSSIVSVIAIFDLTTEARTIAADTFMSFEIWLTVAIMYLVITIALSLVAIWLERRFKLVGK
ncbi:amino acid ABC transporter permease [Aminobacter aganoensis]|uniref:Polar amino acid transport system permease protein n=1 Tax=Aminobacter aganoensis TaxID=83264 RepID=A0A7X0KP34_9HYPH|nr:amino acid ABC transporter permease [Aminobacter aganoensis]MBB6357795.1 polar amino acid transport system permease protein [Aminobacter aganoensis]